MSKLFSEDTLLHYGIPGMKHGVRRWQYPDGRFNEEGKERYFGTPKKRNLNNLNTLRSYNKEGYAKTYFSKEFNNITKDINERRKNEILDNKTGLYLKNNQTSIEDDVNKVNPYYNINKGFQNNCSFCSITYIERRAGYDSVANYNAKGLNTGDTEKLSETVFSKKNIKDSYYNPNYYKLETYKDSIKHAENIINKLQEGEASIISIYNAKRDSGGHYLNAEKRNGKILILDTQPNKIYTFDEFKNIYNNWPIAGITNIDYSKLKFSNTNAVNNISHGYEGGKHMSKLFSEDTLLHYGIPGQKKGVRRWQYPDGRFNEEGKERYFGKKSDNYDNNEIKKDVQKYLQAKMNYGEGSGTNRKLVYAEIKEKMKDPTYKKEFDKYSKMENINKYIKNADVRYKKQIAKKGAKKVWQITKKALGVGATIFSIYYALNYEKVNNAINNKVAPIFNRFL